MTGIRDSYTSIKAKSEGLFKDQGSRFIAFAFPIESVEEVKPIIDALRKEYHDARHHCFAYRIGYDGATFRASDDGEPSGSAGRQILGQIDSAGLSDVLVVVVRYFGGIKLGIPGLIRAYKTSTCDALSNAEKIEKTAKERYRVDFGYLNMNEVMKVVKDLDLKIISQDFGMECSAELAVRLSLIEDFLEKINGIDGCIASKTV